jgi:hypothetical protein
LASFAAVRSPSLEVLAMSASILRILSAKSMAKMISRAKNLSEETTSFVDLGYSLFNVDRKRIWWLVVERAQCKDTSICDKASYNFRMT